MFFDPKRGFAGDFKWGQRYKKEAFIVLKVAISTIFY